MRLHLLFFVLCFFVSSCVPAADPPPAPSGGDEPAAPVLVFLNLERSGQAQLVSQTNLHSPLTILPYSIPADCFVYNLYPNPRQPILAVELMCSDQARVVFLDLPGGQTNVPVEETDSRFLAWAADGQDAYLRTDTLGNPQVIRLKAPAGQAEILPLPPTLYDLAALPGGNVIYSVTRGLGYGSETWLAEADGKPLARLLSQPHAIVAYLRPSPDGSRVAFLLFPDSQIPFPDGELWLMNADGSDPRRRAAADAGHGYAPAWSPDGTQIAFVVRENADEAAAQTSAAALVSNVYRLEVGSGALFPVTRFPAAIVEAPVWSPDGKMLAFNVIENGTIQAWVYRLTDAAFSPLGNISSCCAVWLPGR